jgi:hypothetical protein
MSWRKEQLDVDTYVSKSGRKARISPTLDGKWHVDIDLPTLDKMSIPDSEKTWTFADLDKAKEFCETEFRNRNLD